VERLVVHPAQHQCLTGVVLLDDGRHQSRLVMFGSAAIAGFSKHRARYGFPAVGAVVIASILGAHGQQDRPEHRRVTRGREMLLEPRLTPHAEPLPVLSDSEIRARWLVPHPWRLERVDYGGRRLVVSVAGKLSPGGVRLTETADEVSVTVYVRLAPPGSLIRHIIVFGSVMLDEPLGERRLVDGAG
jgi:hypothetical protein